MITETGNLPKGRLRRLVMANVILSTMKILHPAAFQPKMFLHPAFNWPSNQVCFPFLTVLSYRLRSRLQDNPPSTPLVLNLGRYQADPVSYFLQYSSGSPAGFAQWNAQQRVAYCRRALQDLESEWGPIHSWRHQFVEDWSRMRDEPNTWYDSTRARIRKGDTLLDYLEHIVDGSLPTDLEGMKDLWLQTHQLTKTISAGVVGLQNSLDVVLQYNKKHA